MYTFLNTPYTTIITKKPHILGDPKYMSTVGTESKKQRADYNPPHMNFKGEFDTGQTPQFGTPGGQPHPPPPPPKKNPKGSNGLLG